MSKNGLFAAYYDDDGKFTMAGADRITREREFYQRIEDEMNSAFFIWTDPNIKH
jgi:hypothetical protein